MTCSLRWQRIVVLVLIVMALPALAIAQTGRSVLENLRNTYDTSIEAVDDFTVAIKMEGDMAIVDNMTIYYKKVERDGRPAFETRTEMSGGLSDLAAGHAQDPVQADPLTMMSRVYELFADAATYEGTETVDDAETHVVFIEDMTPLYQEMMRDVGEVDMEVRNARLYVDAEKWVLRKMHSETTMDMGGDSRVMQSTMHMQDYRQVGSLYYPFRMVNSMTNPMSAEERKEMEEAKAQLEQMKAQLDNLPEAQRKQVENMMASINKSSLSGDTIEMVMVVEDVQVNTGVPEALFEN